MTYPITDRTTATRLRERMSYDRDLAHAILDEAWHCTLSFVVDGEPRALADALRADRRDGLRARLHGLADRCWPRATA
jgi:hypothetical protein